MIIDVVTRYWCKAKIDLPPDGTSGHDDDDGQTAAAIALIASERIGRERKRYGKRSKVKAGLYPVNK